MLMATRGTVSGTNARCINGTGRNTRQRLYSTQTKKNTQTHLTRSFSNQCDVELDVDWVE